MGLHKRLFAILLAGSATPSLVAQTMEEKNIPQFTLIARRPIPFVTNWSLDYSSDRLIPWCEMPCSPSSRLSPLFRTSAPQELGDFAQILIVSSGTESARSVARAQVKGLSRLASGSFYSEVRLETSPPMRVTVQLQDWFVWPAASLAIAVYFGTIIRRWLEIDCANAIALYYLEGMVAWASGQHLHPPDEKHRLLTDLLANERLSFTIRRTWFANLTRVKGPPHQQFDRLRHRIAVLMALPAQWQEYIVAIRSIAIDYNEICSLIANRDCPAVSQIEMILSPSRPWASLEYFEHEAETTCNLRHLVADWLQLWHHIVAAIENTRIGTPIQRSLTEERIRIESSSLNAATFQCVASRLSRLGAPCQLRQRNTYVPPSGQVRPPILTTPQAASGQLLVWAISFAGLQHYYFGKPFGSWSDYTTLFVVGLLGCLLAELWGRFVNPPPPKPAP